jgi:hypothetical protein
VTRRPSSVGARQQQTVQAQRPSASDRKSSHIVFLLSAISFFYVQSGGQLYAIEFIFATFLLFYHPHERPQMLRWVGVALLVWGLGSVLSDLANRSEFLDSVKGIARVVFLAIDIYAIFYLCRNRISVIFALWGGLATAGILAFFVQPDVSARTEPWKFGVGVAVTVLVVLLASNSRLTAPWSVAIITALAGVHFVLGFRSMSSILLIVAMVLLVRVSRRRAEVRLTRGIRIRPLAILVTGITAMVVLTEVYDSLARSGTFGQIAAAKASYQSDGQFGSLFSSRSEILLSAQSIADNPVFGGGSFSVATSQVTESAAEIMSRYGYADIANRLSEGSPAYHSEIFGSWAENGVLVLIFWLPMAVLFLRALIGVIYRDVAMPYLVAFVSVTGLWDILFSPFGADRRVWVAASLTTVIAAFVNAPTHRRRILASDLGPHNQLQSSPVLAEVHRLGRPPGVR